MVRCGSEKRVNRLVVLREECSAVDLAVVHSPGAVGEDDAHILATKKSEYGSQPCAKWFLDALGDCGENTWPAAMMNVTRFPASGGSELVRGVTM